MLSLLDHALVLVRYGRFYVSKACLDVFEYNALARKTFSQLLQGLKSEVAHACVHFLLGDPVTKRLTELSQYR